MGNFGKKNNFNKEKNSTQSLEEEFGCQSQASEDLYDLFAVVVHSGTLNGGHYTAIAKNAEHWYEFNDSNVYKLKDREIQSKVVNKNAYILFYQKRGIDFENIEDYKAIRN